MAITFLTACRGEDLSDNVTNIVGDKYVYNMSFDRDISEYGSNGVKTRATKSWNNGDVVYIRASSFYGTATYNNTVVVQILMIQHGMATTVMAPFTI